MASFGEFIFAYEALSIEVASHLHLPDLASLLAASSTIAAGFREAGAVTGASALSFDRLHEEDETYRVPVISTSEMDLVCCVLGAGIFSGSIGSLRGLGQPVLLQAAAKGRPDVVHWLLSQRWHRGLLAGEKDEASGATALHFGALGGHDHVCEILLRDGGSEVDARDLQGIRPLHLAAEQGHVAACRVLLANGAQPDGELGDSDASCGTPTPLLLAAEEGHAEVCSLLVAFRADPLASSQNGRTPLAVAQKASGLRGQELLQTMEAAIWPTKAHWQKQAQADRILTGKCHRKVVLKGPQPFELIRQAMQRRSGTSGV
ncbi:unnamed protein product [Polarella glacialis]|uniref:Uncharacterized protein n=1 Tax=Polarella glacialis TaxID=89957 RepID=A0A813KMX9_POLGL|nr:unnamed protein product [Polarella glacialis]CAE8662894.1 unnamed protein product [Polarella glacialis]CAE8703520.1 unnamed protein product [Polarella glacialis]